MTSTGSSYSIEPDNAPPAPAAATLAIGIVSYNDASTIAGVAGSVREGLDAGIAGFAGTASRILLADAGSTDATIARAKAALGPRASDLVEVAYPRVPGDLLDLPYHGVPGRARALRALFTSAHDLGAT